MYKILRRLPLPRAAAAILFLLVQMGGTLCLPYVTAQIMNRGVIAGDLHYIRTQGFLMIGLSLVSLLGAAANTLIFSQISYRLGEELREELYAKVLTFSKSEFDRFGASSLITRGTNDVTQVQTLVEMGLKFLILAPVQLIGGILMTWLLSPRLAFISMCALPFLAAATAVIYRFAGPLYVKIQLCLDQLNLYFREGLTGVRVIRAFCREQADYEKYREMNRSYARASVKAGTVMSFFMPVFSLCLNIAALLILWQGGRSVDAGALEVGSMIGAVSYSAQILSGFAMLTQIILGIPRGQTSARRIFQVLELTPAVRDPQSGGQPANGPVSLSFAHVNFRYPGAKKEVLSDISFTVRAGQTLAVIGSTGDGKSTLVNMISRLYDVDSGHVRLNGTDVRELPQRELHARVSCAPQTSTLFLGTIRSNLLLAKPEATDREIWDALDLAQASEFVSLLDQGLDSRVEKAGGNFSGGQRQRLCIARALLKDADVYVFDDSFSALDFKTEAAVRSAMKQKTAGRITVIVAQRLSSVANADVIAVLDSGALAGLGTHRELSAGNQVYRQIMDSQTCKEVA